MSAMEAFVVRQGESYRYRQGAWTKSLMLADRFTTRAEAWEIIIKEIPEYMWPATCVVRLVRRCRK